MTLVIRETISFVLVLKIKNKQNNVKQVKKNVEALSDSILNTDLSHVLPYVPTKFHMANGKKYK